MPRREPMGLYIHIPFCRSKCPYCDFCSFPRPTEERMRAYTEELCRRMRVAVDALRNDTGATPAVDTVYFGGGTPTMLPADCAERLIGAVQACFFVLPDAEITVEGNPAAAPRETLDAFVAGGVNRLSLGVQSAQDDELKALGRLHRRNDVIRTVADARAAGIGNINLDFMLGIPHQTEATLADTLDFALSLAPDHLSAYTLMLEEGTPFARRGRAALGLPADEERAEELSAARWEQASKTLRAAGYEHYEISNYARPGRRSRHNLHTWQCRDYLGLGVAAHSCLSGVRFGNSRNLDAFLGGEDITEFRETLTDADRLIETVMLGLRLSDGLDEAALSARFGVDFEATFGERCAPFVAAGYLTRAHGRTALTEAGFLVSNAILADVLADIL